MVPRYTCLPHQYIAQLKIEQKRQRRGEEPKPQPSYTLPLEECLLCIDRHGCSLPQQAESTLENAWHHIQHGIDWQPNCHYKVPEGHAIADIEETILGHRSRERLYHHDNDFHQQGAPVKGMESQQRPHHRTIGMAVPARMQGVKVEDAQTAKHQAQDDTE